MTHSLLGPILFLTSAAVFAQAPVFTMGLTPLQGQLAGGGLVPVTKGILADVDGDGDADVLGVSQFASAFIFVPAQGGSFPSLGAAFPTAANPVAVVTADVDADGDNDAVVLCHGVNYTAPQLMTFFNDGTGGFAAPPLVRSVTTTYYTLFVVRVNNDAVPDLALWSFSGNFQFLIGSAGGVYGPEIPLPTTISAPIAFADDDGDGDDDVHYTTFGGATLHRIRNDGNGTFASPVVSAPLTLGTSSAYLGCGDVNGDGLIDAVLSGPHHVGGYVYQTRVQVALGNGAGGFTPGAVQTIASYGTNYGPLLRDLDGDGDKDLVAYDTNTTLIAEDVVIVSYNDGSGSFGAAIEFETPQGMGWAGVDVADVTGDGVNDVGVFFYTLGQIMVLRSQGAAGLLGPKSINPGGSGGFNYVNLFRVADFNRDGKPDAVSVIGVGAGTSLSIVLDLDNPSPPQLIPVGSFVQDLAFGDWNRDGALDVAAALGASLNGVALLLGNGLGSFAAPLFVPLGAPASAIEAADATGDGNLDIVVVHAQLSTLPGDGAGGFGPPVTTTVCTAPCPGNDALLIGDLSGDGVLDAIVSHYASGATASSTQAWIGTGNGSFLPSFAPSPLPTGKNSVLVEMNADGFLDVVQLSNGVQAVSLWLGSGSGAFTFAATSNANVPGATSYGLDIAAGDVNGDGIPDVVLPTGTVVPGGFGGFGPPVSHLVPYGERVALADVNLDLQTDLVLLQPAKNRIATFRNFAAVTGTAVAFGLGCPGSGGFVPALSAFGLPQPAGTVTLRLEYALGGSPSAALFVSPGPAIIPFGFGCSLFLDPGALSLVPLALLGPGVPGAGHASITVGLPASLPGPLAAAAQAVVLDPASPFSYSSSNGMFFLIQ